MGIPAESGREFWRGELADGGHHFLRTRPAEVARSDTLHIVGNFFHDMGRYG